MRLAISLVWMPIPTPVHHHFYCLAKFDAHCTTTTTTSIIRILCIINYLIRAAGEEWRKGSHEASLPSPLQQHGHLCGCQEKEEVSKARTGEHNGVTVSAKNKGDDGVQNYSSYRS
jgi:hypothetical protein